MCDQVVQKFCWQFLIVSSKEMLGIASKERKAKMVLHLQSLQALLGPFWICRCLGYGCMTCSYMFNLFPTFKHESTRDGCERCFRYLFCAGCAGKTIEPEHSNLFVGNLHKVLFAVW